jgi:hypothetical protein
MTLLGGMGTFAGPVLGAFTIIGLQNLLSDRVGEWVTVIIGAIFVVCVIAFRRGFVGELLAGCSAAKDKARSSRAGVKARGASQEATNDREAHDQGRHPQLAAS